MGRKLFFSVKKTFVFSGKKPNLISEYFKIARNQKIPSLKLTNIAPEKLLLGGRLFPEMRCHLLICELLVSGRV